MSVSSGSDVTIPIQDSPPPPPSPYGNRADHHNHHHLGKTPEPRGDVGIDNAGFEATENEENMMKKQPPKQHGDGKKIKENPGKTPHTEIPMSNGPGTEPPLLTEALNSELINMNIMNTIPDKPQTEFGPYENPDEYFIAVNQHKKFLRSEKLYVTKDKRKVNSWKKYICWLIGACILLSIVTIAILAGLGLISQKTSSSSSSYNADNVLLGTTTSSGLISSSPFYSNALETTSSVDGLAPPSSSSSAELFTSSSSTTVPPSLPPPATRPALSDNHVPAAADITLTFDDAEYTAALNNKSSDRFRELADSVEREMRQALTGELGLSTAYAKVMEFLPGSVVAKMRISWMDDRKELQEVQMFMAKLRQLGSFQIRPGATSFYALVNHCKFRNYGCSHYCTFDYEQLDFLCTCPELLRLAEDGKTCIENVAMSSSTSADVLPLDDVINGGGEKSDDSSISPPEQDHHHHNEHEHGEIPATEPPFIAQSISTEESQPFLHITPSSSSSSSTTTAPVIVADGGSSIDGNETDTIASEQDSSSASSAAVENQGESTGEERSLRGEIVGGESSTEMGMVEATNDTQATTLDVPESVVETSNKAENVTTDLSPSSVAAAATAEPEETEEKIIAPVPLPIETTPAPYIHETFNETEGSSGGVELEEVGGPEEVSNENAEQVTEIPSLSSPTTSQGNTSEEESSIGAPLQRTESDNYSEVEQHQQITTTPLNNTTSYTAIPIVSFNTSRYSEERNVLLSQQQQPGSASSSSSEEGAAEVSLERQESSVGNSSSINPRGEVEETIQVNNNGGTRQKSARLESYGEEPLSRQLNTNATARAILSNSAEFMIYGDNVLSPNPMEQEGGTDSGLIEEDQANSPLNSPASSASLENGTSTEMNNNAEEVINNTNSNENNNSASVESLAGESGENPVIRDSASVQQQEDSVEKTASIVFSGALPTTTPSAGIPEEYTTVRPFDLENDTIVNENATEDRTNAEPIIIQGKKGEQEILVETTPFTAEENPQEGNTNAPESVPTVMPEEVKTTSSENDTAAPPSPRELDVVDESPVIETTLPPLEETTIVMDEAETTIVPSNNDTFIAPQTPSPTTTTTQQVSTVPASQMSSTNTTTTEEAAKSPVAAHSNDTPTAAPAGSNNSEVVNNQLQNNPSAAATTNSDNNNSNNSNNGDRTGSTADNENELS